MRILFIGDIFGNLGIKAIQNELPKLISKNNIDFVIANAENTTNCRGLCEADYQKLMKAGINFITMGNHSWKQKDYTKVLNNPNIIRPFNIDSRCSIGNIGCGTKILNIKEKKVRITNLMGSSIVCKAVDGYLLNPFLTFEHILTTDQINRNVDIHIIDLHAETSSEKNCFFQYFKNKVQTIIGTHTHVQTNDACIINDTAYITDVGMTGPTEGVIGADPKSLIAMFKGESERFLLSEASGKYQFNAVLIEYDDKTNKPISIKNIFIREN